MERVLPCLHLPANPQNLSISRGLSTCQPSKMRLDWDSYITLSVEILPYLRNVLTVRLSFQRCCIFLFLFSVKEDGSIHFVNILIWCEVWEQHSLEKCIWISNFSNTIYGKSLPSPLNCLCLCIKNQYSTLVRVFFPSLYSVLLTYLSIFKLKFENRWYLPTLFLYFKIVWGLLCPLHFHMNFTISLFIPKKLEYR